MSPEVRKTNCQDCGEEIFWEHTKRRKPPLRCEQCRVVRRAFVLDASKTHVATCQHCSKQYRTIPQKAATTRFCSPRCRLLKVAKRYDAGRPRTGAWATRICNGCGKSFNRYERPNQVAKYCSYKCLGIGNQTEWAKSNKPQAVRNWLRRRGRMACCERCGYSEIPEILTIHHKNRDRTNNSKENLEVLCPNCHAIEHLSENRDGWKHISTKNPKSRNKAPDQTVSGSFS